MQTFKTGVKCRIVSIFETVFTELSFVKMEVKVVSPVGSNKKTSTLSGTTALEAVNGKFQPICQPSSTSSASSPKLPNLPTAFSTLVEVNGVKENYTVVYREVYDQKADKGRLEITRNGAKHVDIYDYTLDEVIHIDDQNCTVSSTSDKGHCQFSFFGVGSHIESVSQLFTFGKEFNEKYIGVTSVRGIRCHHWRTCISTNYSSFYLDHFFSVPTWETTWGMLSSTIVRAVLNGISVNVNCINGRWTPLDGTQELYEVYDFFDFRPGPQDPSSFQLPDGVYCKGLKGANKTTPKMPQVFSMDFENTITHYNVVISWQETYDLEKKLVRYKQPNWFNPNMGPVILIHDFNTGIGYNISTRHPGTTCSLFNLTLRNFDATDDGSHHIRMRTSQDFFKSSLRADGSSDTFVYKGAAFVRGIAADVWVGKGIEMIGNVIHQVVQQWYFSQPHWQVESSRFRNFQHQIPLKLDIFSQDQSTMNVFNFNPEATDPSLFDVKPCFNWEEQRLVEFSLNDANRKYRKYVGSKEFVLSLTKAVSAAANVSIIRVNGIQVVISNKKELEVTFTLLDRPKAVGGNVAVVYPEKGLMGALDALRNSVNYGKFKVQFQGETIQAIRSSFSVGFSASNPPPVTATPQSGGGGVSSGAAVGISILMIAVGIGGGLLIAHLIMKRRGTGLFSYQTQE